MSELSQAPDLRTNLDVRMSEYGIATSVTQLGDMDSNATRGTDTIVIGHTEE